MLTIHYTTRFKKDVKRLKKQGKKFDAFKVAINILSEARPLPEKYKDHQLIGNYQGTRECHIGSDWLLIYEIHATELILIRSGSHAELFQK